MLFLNTVLIVKAVKIVTGTMIYRKYQVNKPNVTLSHEIDDIFKPLLL